MIEQGHNLLECETILTKRMVDIRMLGQLDLTQEDLEVLTHLIREQMANGLRWAVRYLEKNAPTCLACFLVGIGTYGYQKHSFWSPVMEALELDPDPASEQQLGSAFLRYLDRHHLTNVEIPSSLKFVTPILLHGGIPNVCLPEYFELLLLGLVQRDGIDPSDPIEISQELAIRRDIERERVELDAQLKTLTNQLANRKKQARTFRQMSEVLPDFADLRRLEQNLQVTIVPPDFPEDYLAYRTHVIFEIERLELEHGSLLEDAERLRQEPQTITEQDIRVLGLSTEIEKCIREFPELNLDAQYLEQLKAEEAGEYDKLLSLAVGVLEKSWSDDYCKLLQDLPSGKLAGAIDRLATVKAEYDRLQSLEHQNGLPAKGNSQWLASVIAMSVGAILLALGLQRSFIGMALLGVVLFACGVWLAWSQYRQGTERDQRSVEFAQQLSAGEDLVNKLKADVVEIVGQLPIQQKYLADPDNQLSKDLSDLASQCTQVSALRGCRIDLEQSVLQRRSFLEQTIAAVGLPSSSAAVESVDLLSRALQDAQQRQAAAIQAKDNTAIDLNSRVALVEETLHAFKADLDHKEAILSTLASGREPGPALEEIESVRRQQRVVVARRQALEKRYPNLANLEPALVRAIDQGVDELTLARMADAFLKQITQMQGQAEEIKAKLDRTSSVFSGIDEPIRRYLLYGGDPAEQFLIDSLWLVFQARLRGNPTDNYNSPLPDRVKRSFDTWWSDWNARAQVDAQASDVSDVRDGGQVRKPYLVFDSGAAEVTATFPVQRIPAPQNASVGEIQVVLDIVTAGRRSSTSSQPLRVYQVSQNLLETEVVEQLVSVPASEYLFSLICNGQTHRDWAVPGLVGDPQWLAFDWQRNQALVQEVPADKVWLLTSRRVEVKPKHAIIEEVALFGQWRDYLVRGLDLAGEDSLELVAQDGTVGRVPISASLRGYPEIDAAKLIEHVYSNGALVFSALPELIVPGCLEEELMQWRLSVLPIGGEGVREPRHYRFNVLPEDALLLNTSPDTAVIHLDSNALLGSESFGAFEIRVRKSPLQPWTASMVVIPSLSVQFEKHMYLPSDSSQKTTVNAEIGLDESMAFEPLYPARLIQNDHGIYRIETTHEQDSVKGLVRFKSALDQSTQVPVVISIPKVRYRFEGVPSSSSVGWSTDVKEIWIGDWETATELSLVVSLPTTIEGTVRLGLNPAGTETQARTLHQGKARFDLIAFGDALRKGPAVQTMVLTAESQELLRNAELFKVRTRWEAQEIECIQEVQGREVVLTVSWTEQGKADGKQRMVCLWRASGGRSDLVVEVAVEDGCYEAKLRESVHTLRPGSYLLEVILVDPWSTTVPSPPRYGVAGTQPIELTSPGDIRQGERFLIRSIWDDQGRVLSLAGKSYRIEIIGKIVNRRLPQGAGSTEILVTRANEGWYVGNLEVEGVPELAAELETTNPVKFQYVAATDQLSAVEDRFGEGAMYCVNCRRMFWSQETNLKEQKIGHGLIGPLEVFKITWESHKDKEPGYVS